MKNMMILLPLVIFSLVSCKKDDNTSATSNLKVSITGLKSLGSMHIYEGWIMVNGSPVSTGTFSVDASGTMSKTDFTVSTQQLSNATAFIVTIEPLPDSDPAPSSMKILAGSFGGNTATLTVGSNMALGNDFSAAAGSFILATPTNGMGTNENSGVWFLNPAGGPGPSLTLPALPSGWKYEGWAVISGMPVTTGKFSMTSGADDAAPFSGSLPGPPFPGEDFLMNAPTGLSFPTDLSGQKIVITIEPDPDNSTAPFFLKPLSGDVPSGATPGISYSFMNTAAMFNPSGSAVK